MGEVHAGEPDRERHQPEAAVRVEEHLRDVLRIAREYQHFGLALEDLEAEGLVGLLEARLRFDPSRRVPFMAYAAWWVRRRIRRAVVEQARIVRIPRTQLDAIRCLRLAQRDLRTLLGRWPTIAEVARASGRRERVVEALLAASGVDVSLDERVQSDGSVVWADVLAERDTPSPWECLLRSEAGTVVARVLASLPERHRVVLSLRYGIGSRQPVALAEIGRLLGVSRERVRQIERDGLKRLRELLPFSRTMDRPAAEPRRSAAVRTPRSWGRAVGTA